MHGKQEVIAGWSEFFKPSVAPFRWQPERVVTNAAGDLGFSSGPFSMKQERRSAPLLPHG